MQKSSLLFRLSLAFVIIMMIFILVVGFMLFSNSRNLKALNKVESEYLSATFNLMEIEKQILFIESRFTRVAAEGSAADSTDFDRAEEGRNTVEELISGLADQYHRRGEEELVRELELLADSFGVFYRTGLNMAKRSQSMGNRGTNPYSRDFHDFSSGFIEEIDTLVMEHQAELKEAILVLEQRFGLVNRVALMGAGLALLFSMVIFLVIMRAVKVPVSELNRAARSLEAGNLADPPRYEKSDELGEVCRSLSSALKGMDGLVVGIRSMVGELSGRMDELAANTGETSAAVTEISGTISSMLEQVHLLDSDIETSADSVDQIAGIVDRFGELVDSLAAVVEQSSAAVNQTIAQIRSVSSIAEKRISSSREMNRALEDGEQKILATDSVVRQVAESVSQIQQMLELINRISAQTNLLSMNAAIEAAHAGDAGRGFSVVASEIRNLAEESGNNAKNISNALKEIILRIQEASETSRISLETFASVKGTAEEVGSAFGEITAAMSEMSSGSEQVLSALGRLNELSGTVTSGSGEIDESTKTVSAAMTRLRQISSQTRSGMEEMKISAEEINRAMADVSQLSEAVGSAVAGVDREIGKFSTSE